MENLHFQLRLWVKVRQMKGFVDALIHETHIALFEPAISTRIHDLAFRILSISGTREESQKIRELTEGEGQELDFKTWWQHTGQLKGTEQWATKLSAIAGVKIKAGTKEVVGNLLYSHVTAAGGWSEEPLQAKLD